MLIEIVDIRDNPGAAYIGRANSTYKLLKSPLANPFVVGRDGTPQQCVDKYEIWLNHAYFHSVAVHATITGFVDVYRELGELTLGCWGCHRTYGVCHGDSIARLIEQIVRQENDATHGD